MATSRTDVAEGVTMALTLWATCFVILRTISRFAILKSPSIDDYLIIVSITLSWISTGLVYTEARFGLGQHQEQVSKEDLRYMLICLYIYIPIYNIGLTVTKLSALFQFLRFFVTRRPRWAAKALISVVFMYGIAVPTVSICSCRPITAFWDQSIEKAKCVNLLIFWYFNASFNIMTDTAIVVLPLYVLKDLNLPKRQKWAVKAIFAVGVITCLTSVIRLYTIFVLLRSPDYSYNNSLPAMWSSIEMNIAITCACMQSLKPLIEKLRPQWFLSGALSSRATVSSDNVLNTANIKRIRKPNSKNVTVAGF